MAKQKKAEPEVKTKSARLKRPNRGKKEGRRAAEKRFGAILNHKRPIEPKREVRAVEVPSRSKEIVAE